MTPDAGTGPDGGTYRRSSGSARGLARRAELLRLVTDDVAAHGLIDFSLRRAAAAAGTTHKVLLYHFQDAESLLAEVTAALRARRVGRAPAGVADGTGSSFVQRVRALWPVLVGAEQDALLQAMGLAVYDPARYADLVRGSAAQYLAALRAICPPEWSDERRDGIAELILATMRGLLLARRAEADAHDVPAGLAALERLLALEEQRDTM